VCLQTALAGSTIVVNKGTNQLALYEDEFLVEVFPVATGYQPDFTPEGTWKMVLKTVYPSWRHPKGGPLIPGGVPENPLGPRWLGLDALGTGGSNYGIHGNNNPSSIGTYASSGCIRMYNKDIVWVYDRVPVGTPVKIINTKDNLAAGIKYPTVLSNGTVISFPEHTGPVYNGEMTYLPARAVAEALGFRLTWLEEKDSLLMADADREIEIFSTAPRVLVNGKPFVPEHGPAFVGGRLYLPLSYFERYLGAKVTPDSENKTIAFTMPEGRSSGDFVRYTLAITVDGKPVNLDEPLGTLSNGEKVMVPVRAVCASAGAAVNWNQAEQSIEIRLRGKKITAPITGAPCAINGKPAGSSLIFTRNGTAFAELGLFTDALGFTSQLDNQARTLKLTTTAITAKKNYGPTAIF